MANIWMYVDGFNFYYWIKNSLKPKIGLGWCDFRKLASVAGFASRADVTKIKYFTARVDFETMKGAEEKKRYELWLSAAQSIEGLEPCFGRHVMQDGRRKEKQTDVNIAIQLLLDGLEGRYDSAILLTGDLDLAPALFEVQSNLKIRRTVKLLMPGGQSADGWCRYFRERGEQPPNIMTITEKMLVFSLLKYHLKTGTKSIDCPPYWQLSSSILRNLPREQRPDYF